MKPLPATNRDGTRLCLYCAGVTEDLSCRTCGATHDRFCAWRLCTRCALGNRLRRVFDDGTGSIDVRFGPLVDALAAAAAPRGSLRWLESHANVERIRALANGDVSLSHDGIDGMAPSNGREHLRELLVHHGILVPRERYLAAFDRWSSDLLARIANTEDRRVIAVFLRWQIRPRLERTSAAGELTETRYAAARTQTNVALRFLAWLRESDRDLASATQADIDRWFAAAGPGARAHVRSFLGWTASTKRSPRFELPTERATQSRPMAERERLALLARLLDDDTIAVADRVAGCLVLLYALPVSRIHRLRPADFDNDNDGMTIRLGSDPIPVPEPLAALVTELAAHRTNLGGAGHHNGEWLFPGRRAGQPIDAENLVERLNRLGITKTARTAALNALLHQVPAPVASKVLGRRPWRVAASAKTLGTDWSNYAALKTRA